MNPLRMVPSSSERIDEVDQGVPGSERQQDRGDTDEHGGVAGRTIVELHPHEGITIELHGLEKAAEDDAQTITPF